jgi:hypothetical protein
VCLNTIVDAGGLASNIWTNIYFFDIIDDDLMKFSYYSMTLSNISVFLLNIVKCALFDSWFSNKVEIQDMKDLSKVLYGFGFASSLYWVFSMMNDAYTYQGLVSIGDVLKHGAGFAA